MIITRVGFTDITLTEPQKLIQFYFVLQVVTENIIYDFDRVVL